MNRGNHTKKKKRQPKEKGKVNLGTQHVNIGGTPTATEYAAYTKDRIDDIVEQPGNVVMEFDEDASAVDQEGLHPEEVERILEIARSEYLSLREQYPEAEDNDLRIVAAERKPEITRLYRTHSMMFEYYTSRSTTEECLAEMRSMISLLKSARDPGSGMDEKQARKQLYERLLGEERAKQVAFDIDSTLHGEKPSLEEVSDRYATTETKRAFNNNHAEKVQTRDQIKKERIREARLARKMLYKKSVSGTPDTTTTTTTNGTENLSGSVPPTSDDDDRARN